MHTQTSSDCVNRHGRPRRGYPDPISAEDAADRVFLHYGTEMVAYQCDDCWDWHLCPAEYYTPNHHCDNCSKRAYDTEDGAQRRAKLIMEEQGAWLRVYECPYGDGWHLTSRL